MDRSTSETPKQKLDRFLKICERIECIPKGTKLEAHDALCKWEWHPALGDSPDGWDEMTHEERLPHIKEWMGVLETELERKEILRYHHIHNLGSTVQEFEDWWDSMVLREILEEIQSVRIIHDPTPVTLAASIVATVVSLIAIVMQLC